ncbi:hypothetical protein MTO96_032488 [Rhipicephalus appendiculatus]
METLLAILLSCCCACFVEGNTAPNRSNSNGMTNERANDWEKCLEELRKFKEYQNPLPIGGGVQFNAQIMYDEFYKKKC